MAQPDVWITQVEAARRLGVAPSTVQAMLAREDLRRAPAPAGGGRRPRGVASVDAASVEQARTVLDEARAARAAVAARAAAAGQPPDHDHVWLDTPAVAALTAMSRAWVKARAREGRIPATKHGGQWWVRRDHAEQVAAARAVGRR